VGQSSGALARAIENPKRQRTAALHDATAPKQTPFVSDAREQVRNDEGASVHFNSAMERMARDNMPPEMFSALNPFCKRMRVA
jgi:hypothetical protein